jgi:hypothetical protein
MNNIKTKTNYFLLNTLGLPIIDSLDSLSDTLAISKNMIYLLSKCNYNYYVKTHIPKKDGTKREILIPNYSMKMTQRWILQNILYKIRVSDNAKGYKKGIKAPLVENAMMHHEQLYCLILDVENFFPSIGVKRICNLFERVGYNSLISYILARICTYKDYLPQGAVTSPYLANLVCFKLDRRIDAYCCKREISYTRYCDDLIFSSDNLDSLKKAYKMFEVILCNEGFKLNRRKTRFLTPNTLKQILGITINDELIKAPKIMKRKVKALIFKSIVNKDYRKNDVIRGYIAYIKSIENNYQNKIEKYVKRLHNKDFIRGDLEVVKAYNENKLYSNFPDLAFSKAAALFLENPELEELM